MKMLLLSVALSTGLAVGALASPSGAAADVVALPPNPLLGEPLSILVTQNFGRGTILVVSVQLNPPEPDTEVNPPDPDIEIITPQQ